MVNISWGQGLFWVVADVCIWTGQPVRMEDIGHERSGAAQIPCDRILGNVVGAECIKFPSQLLLAACYGYIGQSVSDERIGNKQLADLYRVAVDRIRHIFHVRVSAFEVEVSDSRKPRMIHTR